MTMTNEFENYEELSTQSLTTKKEFAHHKLNEGVTILRILPPIPEMEKIGFKGYPFKFNMVTWGLIDPNKGIKKPVNIHIQGKKDIVFEYCNALSAKIEEQKEVYKNSLKAKNPKASEADINKAVFNTFKPYIEFLTGKGGVKPQRKFSYNAASQDGKIALLDASKSVQDGVKAALAKYQNETGLNPVYLGDGGVWLKITRTGKGQFDTEYKVEINQIMEKTNGKVTYSNDNTPLPENIKNNYYSQKLYYDLTTLYTSLTEEEVKERLFLTIKETAKELPLVGKIEGFNDFSCISEVKIQKPEERKAKVEDSQEEMILPDDPEDFIAAPQAPATKPATKTTQEPPVAPKGVSTEMLQEVDDLLNGII